jgi:hypothetical protein
MVVATGRSVRLHPPVPLSVLHSAERDSLSTLSVPSPTGPASHPGGDGGTAPALSTGSPVARRRGKHPVLLPRTQGKGAGSPPMTPVRAIPNRPWPRSLSAYGHSLPSPPGHATDTTRVRTSSLLSPERPAFASYDPVCRPSPGETAASRNLSAGARGRLHWSPWAPGAGTGAATSGQRTARLIGPSAAMVASVADDGPRVKRKCASPGRKHIG